MTRIGDRRGAYRVLVGKHERKRPLVGSRRRRQDTIKMGFEEVGLRLRIGASGRIL